MPTNEEGEFELVLGNKQLLSVFFVAVLLLGVFFIMGYIVGRNLSPEPPLIAGGRGPTVIDVDAASPVTAAPTAPAIEPDKPAAMPPKPEPTPVASKVAPPKPVEATKAEASKQAEALKKAEAPKPVVAPKKAEAKPAPVPKRLEPPKPAPPVVAAAKPVAGATYLQVAAAGPAKVDTFIKNLTAKGFKVTTQPVPGSELVRVLVGPYDGTAVADGAAKLKAAGFDSIRKKL